MARALTNQGIATVFDLLLCLPNDYENKAQITPIAQLYSGQKALVAGRVVSVSVKNRVTWVIIDDGARLTLTFFRVYANFERTFYVGAQVLVYGQVKDTPYGRQMAQPKPAGMGITPIYPIKHIAPHRVVALIKSALLALKDELSAVMIDENNSLYRLLSCIHQPSEVDLEYLIQKNHPYILMLACHELAAHLLHAQVRKSARAKYTAPICPKSSPLCARLLAELPFAPTDAQLDAVNTIISDMASAMPMLRLVQGDVGAGKTLVAAMAACHALDGGQQVALMAPTEVLAEQHFESFCRWFLPLGKSVVLLLGRDNAKTRKQNLQLIEQGADIIIGTHALFSDGVNFLSLGLVVIDEQHRFGVAQRLGLSQKADGMPHQLLLSATPIPRTLFMSQHGDVDLSIINQMPKGRLPIITALMDNARRDEVIERVQANCDMGRQIYWVCALIDDGDIPALAAEVLYDELCQRLNARVGLVHGKLKSAEKSAIMADFKAHKLDVLIATTVIEVGVDVPNASIMIIENAERLGLSQLHQLRGRVGRGTAQSYCLLLYQAPLSDTGKTRLLTIKNSTDGFDIARADLSLRGAGDILGSRQAGQMSYKIYDQMHHDIDFDKVKDYCNTLDDAKKNAVIGLWLPNQNYWHA